MNKTNVFPIFVLLGLLAAGCQLAVKYDEDKIPKVDSGHFSADNLTAADVTNDTGVNDTGVNDTGANDTDANDTDVNDTGVFDAEVESSADSGECSGAGLWCTGVCVPNDALNCGVCGHTCSALPHVASSINCANGVCDVTALSCEAGWAHCSSNPEDGCETDLSKPETCGVCTHNCKTLPHLDGPVHCEQGTCTVPISSCASGWAHCSSNPDDGCETDLSIPENCGGCGNTCPAGAPLCVEKTNATGGYGYGCVLDCSPESPTQCGNTCVNTANSPANCGQCNNSCTTPNFATATCSNSICGFSCNNTYLRCSGACVPNNERNCGTCGKDCTSISHLACTQYLCASNACALQITNGYCFIDNTCYDNSANRPGNDCQYCDSTSNAQAWRDKNSGSCDDGNLCTSNDICSSGVCSGTKRNCNDGNVCTDDSCNSGSGCVRTNNKTSCTDGNACTTNDTCSGGACRGGFALTCNDNNLCTDDSCNPVSGCVRINNTISCDDGNFCSGLDTCAGGSCGHSGVPCISGLNNRVCFPTPSPGSCGCNTDGDCDSTHFCNASHVCTTKGGYNAACTAANQSLSNICNSNTCGCATTPECASQNLGHVCRAGNVCGCDVVGDCPTNFTCDTVTTHQCAPPK